GRPKLDTGFYAEIAADGNDDENAECEKPQTEDAPAAKGSKPAGLPRQLVDELAIQRRDILAVEVAADPALALDLATFLMVDGAEGYSLEKSGSTLSAARPSDPVAGFKTPDARATLAGVESVQALDRRWTEGSTR